MVRAMLLPLVLLAANAAGCASAPLRGASFLPPVFRASFFGPSASASKTVAPLRVSSRGTPGSAGLVERALKARGLRFGTDGSPEALYAFVRYSHDLVPAARARPGDLVFFDLAGRGRCGDHVGLVEGVEPEGRIRFREARAGAVRRSYVHPGAPDRRRDDAGRVLNTFLRPKRLDDPVTARYFAGQMLCAVGRVEADR